MPVSSYYEPLSVFEYINSYKSTKYFTNKHLFLLIRPLQLEGMYYSTFACISANPKHINIRYIRV